LVHSKLADSNARGPQNAEIYNEQYSVLASKKHPALLGAPMIQGWAEIAEALTVTFAKAVENRPATITDDAPLYVDRNGYLKEIYFSFAFTPMLNEYEFTEGSYTAIAETTKQQLWERRTRT